MLRSLVDPSKLTSEQQEHIDVLQSEIDEIWNRRGDYKIDPDAWENMPIFMETITEEDIEKNENCAALSSIVYDEVPPDEVAENRKEHGNSMLKLALNPNQERRENLAKAACDSYTEALQAKGKDMQLTAIIYSNRSLARFIIGNYGHGLEDAQRAIILSPDYHKAYYRAAKCAERLGKYDLALGMLSRGKQVKPPLDAKGLQEFQDLENVCHQGKSKVDAEKNRKIHEAREKAVDVVSLTRYITSLGIRLSKKSEVMSEQMAIYGNPQPYFDTEGMLHVPILFIYDEYQQTDIMQDVSCDLCTADLLDEMIPFPWDEQGRYRSIDDIVVCFNIDDGIKEPEYHVIDVSQTLLEVFRDKSYVMPGFLPVLHVLCRSSELLGRYKIIWNH
ncbi:unnamed protein product [Phytomonas sp. EM1]|nr:unnamed protein product [Phytomonas sp. EM1]|eukprot:CCW63085.1 unnamed protein product [Phytomonas sp. isolate EM1]